MAKTPTVTKVTMWHFLRDVFVASINKGQFPMAILGLIIVIYMVRVSPEQLAEFGKSILASLQAGNLWGYLLFILTLGGWYTHTKSLRRKHFYELGRIAGEKTGLQKRELGNKVKSSKGK
jgi:hypothetical protein